MKDMLTTPLGQFRIVSFSEGLSYLLLLFVAMPMKYMAGEPLMVRIFGSIHGALFVFFMISLIYTAFDRSWRMNRVLLAFGASIVPFGAFFLERSLKKEMNEALAPIPIQED